MDQGDTYVLRIVIQGKLPKSANKMLRTHWRGNHSQTRGWKLALRQATRAFAPSSPLKKVQISVTRHNYRFLDFDGVVTSVKGLIDALHNGDKKNPAPIMVDDSWKVTGPWIIDQIFRPKSSGPVLEIQIMGERK